MSIGIGSQTPCWAEAAGMPALHVRDATAPMGASVPDREEPYDHVAVIYPKGQTPPLITVENLSTSVQKVMANGVAIAVVARPEGPAIAPDDVLLVERVI